MIKVLDHLTVIFGMVFLVFLVLDQFNPLMDFTGNSTSRWMLAVFCVSCISRSVQYRRQAVCDGQSGRRP